MQNYLFPRVLKFIRLAVDFQSVWAKAVKT